MDKKPIICPWCGSPMQFNFSAAFRERDNIWNGYFECCNCWATSPYEEGVEGTQDEAREMILAKTASRRLQVPLTYKQLLKHEHGYVFWETRDDIEACRVEFCNMADLIEVYWIGTDESDVYDHKDYGRRFRCWNHYPTEEERNAAEWKT